MAQVIVNFPNQTAAKHFVLWLNDSGQQDYWNWTKQEETKVAADPLVVRSFVFPVMTNQSDTLEVGTFVSEVTPDLA